MEAAALHALAHPDKLWDIGIALKFGTTRGSCITGVSTALRQRGHRRKCGRGSAAFDQSIFNGDMTRKHDHQAILAWIKGRPDLNYQRIGEEFRTNQAVVAYVAIKHGIRRGTGRSDSKKVQADGVIRAYCAANPGLSNRQLAWDLGYSHGGFEKAMQKAGHKPPPPDGEAWAE